MTMLPRSDRATYTPALQPDYAATVSCDPSKIRDGNIPAGLALSDFNFLNPGGALLTHPIALYSAGHDPENPPPAIIRDRDRTKSTLIGDSGGYQIKKGKLTWREDRTRQAILEFLETYADYSMTLDHPPPSVKGDKLDHAELQNCLDKTNVNLKFFDRGRQGRTKWINVIQGRDMKEIAVWIESVKWFDSVGWAAGGEFTLNPANLLELMIYLRDNGLLDGREIFHQFGKGSISLACFYTEVQQAMRQAGIDITITFDTSSPFRMTGEYGNQYTNPAFTSKCFGMSTGKVFQGQCYVGSAVPFPFTSAVGRLITLGDICVQRGVLKASSWDALSHVMIKHHNLDAYLRGLEIAHNISALDDLDAQNHSPRWLMFAREAARRVFKTSDPMTVIKHLKRDLRNEKADKILAEDDCNKISV
ncbi:hypothetical protein [Roseomonas genomospecies 6]|uniref:Uncharacterized protein n=1 Tax=Roseomonas genomospecies 6 TaxID=214106 RepID=A0A9W7NL56_9PROT|nr:hypothetical protein [Roseomonas genomospecies 6]KAA0681892.1 hypothetical protein DS843_08975 [Roseomonas genomospecies 6]